jgi:hypothetical protein
MCCAFHAGLLAWGIVTLVTGKLSFTKTMVVEGPIARILGCILIVCLPLNLLFITMLALSHMEPMSLNPLAVVGQTAIFCLGLGIVLAVGLPRAGMPASQRAPMGPEAEPAKTARLPGPAPAHRPSGGPRHRLPADEEAVDVIAVPKVLPPVRPVLPPTAPPLRPEGPARTQAPPWLLFAILGGVGLVTFLGLILAFWLGKGKPAEVEYKLLPNGVRQPSPPADVSGKTTVDLIPLIDPAKDRVHGDWNTQYGILQCTSGGFVPRIQIPYQPPAEYDFVVMFSQRELRNGISLIMPNPNGGAYYWYVGIDSGEYGFGGNPGKKGPGVFYIKPDTFYTTIVEVRRDGVRALVNGKLLLDHKHFRDLGVDNWRSMPDTKVLGVACDDPTVFHYVRVLEISGKGTKTR